MRTLHATYKTTLGLRGSNACGQRSAGFFPLKEVKLCCMKQELGKRTFVHFLESSNVLSSRNEAHMPTPSKSNGPSDDAVVDILSTIDAHLAAHHAPAWSGTFRDYLPIVIATPSLAQRAHARLYAMIRNGGVIADDDGAEHYAFFENDLFGIDGPLARVVEYFKAAAMGSDVGGRILLLYGPPSSGKSQLAILLKRGLEAYTQTDPGAVYAMAECPQHEDPLHLIPHALRREFEAKTGIEIEGELCPMCALTLRETYEGDIYRVPVQRVVLSAQGRLGIGPFVPCDEKS